MLNQYFYYQDKKLLSQFTFLLNFEALDDLLLWRVLWSALFWRVLEDRFEALKAVRFAAAERARSRAGAKSSLRSTVSP